MIGILNVYQKKESTVYYIFIVKSFIICYL